MMLQVVLAVNRKVVLQCIDRIFCLFVGLSTLCSLHSCTTKLRLSNVTHRGLIRHRGACARTSHAIELMGGVHLDDDIRHTVTNCGCGGRVTLHHLLGKLYVCTFCIILIECLCQTLQYVDNKTVKA